MKRALSIPPKVRAEVRERSGGDCEARINGVCRGRATQMHHRLLRSQGGKHTPANLLDLCGRCHDHIHKHTAWAYEHGFLLAAFTQPSHVRIIEGGHMGGPRAAIECRWCHEVIVGIPEGVHGGWKHVRSNRELCDGGAKSKAAEPRSIASEGIR